MNPCFVLFVFLPHVRQQYGPDPGPDRHTACGALSLSSAGGTPLLLLLHRILMILLIITIIINIITIAIVTVNVVITGIVIFMMLS